LIQNKKIGPKTYSEAKICVRSFQHLTKLCHTDPNRWEAAFFFFFFHCELNILVKSNEVVQKFCHPFLAMWPNDESVIYMSEPAYRFVCCMFYWKPTHTNLYLLRDSHHLPANKQSVLDSLIHRAKVLCDQGSLTQELEFLTTDFKENGYSPQQIQQALKPITWTAKTNERPPLIAFIPYTQTTNGQLSRMLAKHNIKSVSLPPRKIHSYLPPVKDALGFKNAGCVQHPM